MLHKAVFLDRDGTINVEKDYLFKPEDFEFETGAIESVARLNQMGYKVIVVSNQSGVARGYYSEEDVNHLHTWVNDQLAGYQAHIDAFYFCPHHPTVGQGSYLQDCGCRKPKPGLILRAMQEHNISREHSFMIGDTITDMEAGLAAGLKCILVKTGHGRKQVLSTLNENIKFQIADNLLAAVKLVSSLTLKSRF